MSKREDIASNIITVLDAMTSPVELKQVTREPFEFERLSNAQFPAAWIVTGDESRADSTIASSSSKRMGTIDYTIVGFVKGDSIDTARNQLIEGIEEALDADLTRGSNAIHTETVEVSTDEGLLDPVGGVRIVVRVTYDYTRGIT